MLAIRLFLLAVEEYCREITKDNKICCDNKGALFTFKKKSNRECQKARQTPIFNAS